MLEIGGINIRWNGATGHRLKTEDATIYIDPFKLIQRYDNKKDADLIFITHNHFDHLSVKDIDNVINNNTKIICPHECLEILNKNYGENEIVPLKPQDNIVIKNVKIEAVKAYNTNKDFHPK